MLERGSQVHFMAEFQELLDFPPAPKLDVFGKLDPDEGHASRSCAARSCSSARRSARRATRPPYYTDNPMHNLKVERFFKPQMINGRDGDRATGRSRRSRCAASRTRRRTCTTAGC